MIRLSGSVKLSCASSGGTPKSRANGLWPRLLRPSSGVRPFCRSSSACRASSRAFAAAIFASRSSRRCSSAGSSSPRTSGPCAASSAASVASACVVSAAICSRSRRLFVAHPSVTHRLVLARIGLHLRPIHRQRPELDDARFAGDRHDLHEQRLERRQVLLPKLRDRSVRRKIARRQHAIRDILFQLPRDPTRRKRPGGIRVHQHRHHHLRIERLIAAPIPLVGRVERLQIQRGDRVGDEERQMAFGEPVARRRREQQRLIGRTRTKCRRHTSLYVPPTPRVSAAQTPRAVFDSAQYVVSGFSRTSRRSA